MKDLYEKLFIFIKNYYGFFPIIIVVGYLLCLGIFKIYAALRFLLF